MNLDEFKDSIAGESPQPNVSIYLQALWWDAKGDWDRSHQTIQDVTDENASWIHAYLHRKEGDSWNADYWYRRARKERFSGSLNEEWEHLVLNFL